MLRIRSIANAGQQRTLRALYAHTQGYPYAGFLSATLSDGSTAFVPGSGTTPGTGGQGPIFPGQVAGLSTVGENMVVYAAGATTVTNCVPFGFFGNFIGGDFDEVGDYTEIGVWRGPGSVYEVLSPAFNANITASNTASATARKLYADANGLLNGTQVASGPQIATLLSYVSTAKIVVEMILA